MFNGIIYNKGIVDKIIKRSKGINLFIKSSLKINSKFKTLPTLIFLNFDLKRVSLDK